MDRVNSCYYDQLVRAHLFQGNTNDCGPYCAAIILKACGKKLDAAMLAKNMSNWTGRKLITIFNRVPNWATFPWGIVGIFREAGISARWRMFSSIKHLKTCLSNNIIPIVITGNLKPLWSHYTILVSISENSEFGFIDPALEKPNISWVAGKDFYNRWLMMGKIVVEIFPNNNFCCEEVF